MNSSQLFERIRKKRSFLCVGLDPEMDKIPEFLHKEKDPIFEFNRRIIDATYKFAVAYKPNVAFYESYGARAGQLWERLPSILKTRGRAFL